jgi:hypothetical protein
MSVLDALSEEIARADTYIGKLHEHVMTVVEDGMSETEGKQKDSTVSEIRAKLAKNKSAVVENAALALQGAKGHLVALEAKLKTVTDEKGAERSTLQAEIDNLRETVTNSETYIEMYRKSHDAIEKLAKSLTGLTAFGRDSTVAFGRVAPRFV